MGDDAAPGVWEPAAPSVVSSAFASLSVDQLAAQYQAEGYVLLPQLLAEEAVATALADAERVLAERASTVPSQWLLGLHQPAQPRPQPWVAALALDLRLGRLVAALLGTPAVALLSSQLFVKEPGGAAVPWHQDGENSGQATGSNALPNAQT